MLELKNVSFEVTDVNGEKKKILDDINLRFDEDKFVVITGPNGSGKSTLARILMGIETPTSGKIYLDGEDITGKTITERAKLGISFALQQPVRFKGIKVRDLIEIAAGRKMETNEACEYLSRVGLCARDYIDREVNASLSGGELKRIEIASILARGTKIALFDEPEAGIDLWSFQNLIQVFERMQSKTETGSIMVISHQERILNIADEIIVLKEGQLQYCGPKEEVLPKLNGTDSSIPGCGKGMLKKGEDQKC